MSGYLGSSPRDLLGGVLFVAAAGLVLLFASCRAEEASLLRATFVSPSGARSPEYRLEIASTPAERTKGLMYRKSLPRDHGMIFVFPGDGPRSFWMKNTYVPLDMLFVGGDLKVRGVLHDVPVLNEAPRTAEGVESTYVVELAAGSAREAGIGTGWTLEPAGPLPRAVPDRAG